MMVTYHLICASVDIDEINNGGLGYSEGNQWAR